MAQGSLISDAIRESQRTTRDESLSDIRLIDFIERLNGARTVTGKWQVLNTEIRALGFEGATYGLSSGLRNDEISKEVIYYSSYPKAFFDSYIREGLADDDYAVLHCAHSNKPAFWTDIKARYPAPRAALFNELASDFGLREGLVVPFRAPHDAKVSGIGLSFGAHGDGRDIDWPYVLDLCTAFDEVMRQPTSLEQTYRLSHREIECLRLICVGYLNKEIASRLGLSDKTVEHYLKHAIQKLRARNKHHAAAKAAILGLITL